MCDKLPCPLITKVTALFLMCILTGRQSTIIIIIMIHTIFFLAVGIGCIVFVLFFKKNRKEKSSPYAKMDEKGYEHIPMATKDSDSWKYKKLEDGEGGDYSDSTTDEHKKMLN